MSPLPYSMLMHAVRGGPVEAEHSSQASLVAPTFLPDLLAGVEPSLHHARLDAICVDQVDARHAITKVRYGSSLDERCIQLVAVAVDVGRAETHRRASSCTVTVAAKLLFRRTGHFHSAERWTYVL